MSAEQEAWQSSVLAELEKRDHEETSELHLYSTFSRVCHQLNLVTAQNSHNLQTLLDENTQLLNERNLLIERVNASVLVQDKSKSELVSAHTEIASLQLQLKTLTSQLRDANEALHQKNKSIEKINDQLLLDQMQVNLLHAKNEQLQLENESLVKRWMAKVAADAELLNNANENR